MVSTRHASRQTSGQHDNAICITNTTRRALVTHHGLCRGDRTIRGAGVDRGRDWVTCTHASQRCCYNSLSCSLLNCLTASLIVICNNYYSAVYCSYPESCPAPSCKIHVGSVRGYAYAKVCSNTYVQVFSQTKYV